MLDLYGFFVVMSFNPTLCYVGVEASEAGRRFDSCRAHQKQRVFDLRHATKRKNRYHLHLTY